MKINHCTIAHKYRYDAHFADRKYRELLSSSRAGINMIRHQLHQKDQIVTPLIAQGQSPYQILINHPELDMSVRSMYTYIDKGLFTARNVDLKRQAKFKPRKCHKTQIKDREVFTSRTYADFCSMELNSYVQMDTVKRLVPSQLLSSPSSYSPAESCQVQFLTSPRLFASPLHFQAFSADNTEA